MLKGFQRMVGNQRLIAEDHIGKRIALVSAHKPGVTVAVPLIARLNST